MVKGQKVMVVMPAYNAAKTLEKTILEIPSDIVDEILLVDDCSKDETVAVAQKLGVPYVVHPRKSKSLVYVGVVARDSPHTSNGTPSQRTGMLSTI